MKVKDVVIVAENNYITFAACTLRDSQCPRRFSVVGAASTMVAAHTSVSQGIIAMPVTVPMGFSSFRIRGKTQLLVLFSI